MKIRFSLLTFCFFTMLSFSSCHKRAVCPAYQHIDPTEKYISMSKEKFVNNTKFMTDSQRKKYNDKRGLDEVNYIKSKRKSLNLLPSHMRKWKHKK